MADFASLLSSYDGAAAPAPAPARIPKKQHERSAWSRLSRDERKLRDALERGAKHALSDAKQAVAARPPGRRLAVCFTVVDGLPHEACWRRWAAELATHDVDVAFYAHAHKRAAAKASSAWLEERLIRDHYQTRWGSIELVRATLALLDAALVENPAWVAFASETCVPIDVKAAVAAVEAPTTFLTCTCRPDNGYARERQWEKVDRVIAAATICKADQWAALSAVHARTCAALDASVRREARRLGARDAPSLWRLLRKCTAADELLFPVSLALAGELRKPADASTGTARLAPDHDLAIVDRRLTYCDWSRGGTSPKTFAALTADVVSAARAAGCLFARKVAAAVDEATWVALVIGPAKRARDDAAAEDPSSKRVCGGAGAA